MSRPDPQVVVIPAGMDCRAKFQNNPWILAEWKAEMNVKTAREIEENVREINPIYPPGDPMRYGAIADE